MALESAERARTLAPERPEGYLALAEYYRSVRQDAGRTARAGPARAEGVAGEREPAGRRRRWRSRRWDAGRPPASSSAGPKRSIRDRPTTAWRRPRSLLFLRRYDEALGGERAGAPGRPDRPRSARDPRDGARCQGRSGGGAERLSAACRPAWTRRSWWRTWPAITSCSGCSTMPSARCCTSSLPPTSTTTAAAGGWRWRERMRSRATRGGRRPTRTPPGPRSRSSCATRRMTPSFTPCWGSRWPIWAGSPRRSARGSGAWS